MQWLLPLILYRVAMDQFKCWFVWIFYTNLHLVRLKQCYYYTSILVKIILILIWKLPRHCTLTPNLGTSIEGIRLVSNLKSGCGCSASHESLIYECTVMGGPGGATVWTGTALNCPSDEISPASWTFYTIRWNNKKL